ncbi:MAG: hypothetical protein WEB30_11975 [Cyclobacteriaceae bacterium]
MPVRKSTVDIKSGRLFPFQFLVLGFIILLSGFAVVGPYMIIGIILIIAGAVILTAHEGTEIMPDSNSYREYNSILFIKTGKGKKYQRIEKIFINPVRVSKTIYTAHTSSSSTFQDVEYNAYLKFSDGEKIFLLSGKNKNRIRNRLKIIAETLNIPLQDNTGAK